MQGNKPNLRGEKDLSTSIKKEIIRLLKEDEEFRYMVAGLIGIEEMLKRLDRIESEIKGLREEQVRLREEQTKIWDEIKGLREEQTKIWDEIKGLREEQTKIWDEIKGLREDFNKMLEEIRRINIRLNRIERTVEKLTVDVEEEARSFIKYHLEQAGISMDIDTLKLPEAEINIYGANKDWCVIGEASLRGGIKILDELLDKYKLLKEKYPGYLRKNVILVLYVILPLPELVSEARKRNIWLLKATKEYVSLKEIIY